jgi:hypothetical protein
MSTVTVTIDQEWDVAIHIFEGNASYADISTAISKYAAGAPTQYTVWDFSAATFEPDLTNEELQQLSRQTPLSWANRKDPYDVIIVPSLVSYGLARAYSSYADVPNANAKITRTLVFRDRNAGLAWIKDNALMNKKSNI